jgi:hypothetical protein
VIFQGWLALLITGAYPKLVVKAPQRLMQENEISVVSPTILNAVRSLLVGT